MLLPLPQPKTTGIEQNPSTLGKASSEKEPSAEVTGKDQVYQDARTLNNSSHPLAVEAQKMIAHMQSRKMKDHAIESFKKSFEFAPEATVEHFKKNYKDYGPKAEDSSPQPKDEIQSPKGLNQPDSLSKKVDDMKLTLEILNDRIEYLEEKGSTSPLLQKSHDKREGLYREFLTDSSKLETLKSSSPEMYEKVMEFGKSQERSKSWDRGR